MSISFTDGRCSRSRVIGRAAEAAARPEEIGEGYRPPAIGGVLIPVRFGERLLFAHLPKEERNQREEHEAPPHDRPPEKRHRYHLEPQEVVKRMAHMCVDAGLHEGLMPLYADQLAECSPELPNGEHSPDHGAPKKAVSNPPEEARLAGARPTQRPQRQDQVRNGPDRRASQAGPLPPALGVPCDIEVVDVAGEQRNENEQNEHALLRGHNPTNRNKPFPARTAASIRAA